MDLNDVLFPITFNIEHHVMHSHEEILDSDPHATLHSSGRFVAVEVIDDNTIGLYVDYWHFDEDEIVDTAGIWPFLPWEMYYAMDRMVHAGEADWYSSSARAHSGNWLDMLDAGDAALAARAPVRPQEFRERHTRLSVQHAGRRIRKTPDMARPCRG